MTGTDSSDSALDTWLDTHWSPDITLRDWWALLAASGYGFPTWPIGRFGRGGSRADARRVSAGLHARHAIGAPTGLGTLMGAPVVLTHGTDEQQDRLLPPLANGTEGWCQLFSEPGAGSDLASLSTRAIKDGDEWIVTGQKVWTSGAMHSRRGMLIARTNADAGKHRGITYFIIDMEQPGVDVRPLHQMNGRSHFSEVFFSEARVHDRDRIGDTDAGWAVATATLQFERAGLAAADASVRPPAGERAGQLDRTVGAIIDEARATRTADEADPGRFERLLEVANHTSASERVDVRHDLARIAAQERIAEYSRLQAAAAARAGRSPGAASSVGKLYWTNGLRESADLGMRLLGAHGMLTGEDSATGGALQTFVLSVPSASIAGGTDEIQRNIIGERTLGLPREPSVDPDTPFRDLPRS
jgi:alkylation response protein AidB-like acyl-CoA dehydrogenase